MDIYKNKLTFLYDSYNGTNGYEPYGKYSYLIPFRRENKDDYRSRRSTNIYQNYYAPLINIYLAPIFGNVGKFTTSNTNLNNLYYNTNLVKHSLRATRDLKMYEFAYFGVSFEDEITLPDIFNIDPKDINENVIKNNEIVSLEYMEYHDYKDVNVPVLCSYENEVLTKYTLAWYDGNGDITLEKTDKRLTYFDSITETYIWKQGPNDLNETPSSFQIALSNLDIFNKKSLVNEIEYKNAISVLTISTDQDIDEIELGVNNILKVPSDVSNMPEYLEISSVNYDIITDDIEKTKSYLFKMFSNHTMEDSMKYTTALSTALASKTYNEQVNFLYINYQMITNKIFNKMREYFGLPDRYTIEFEVLELDADKALESVKQSFED